MWGTNKKRQIFIGDTGMSQAWKTYTVVALIIGLLLGIGVGWLAKPVPIVVTEEEYKQIQEELSSTLAELNETKALLEEFKAALVGAGSEAPVKSTLKGEVKIGGLFSLTGDLASYGENEYTAAKIAAKHVNLFLKAIGANWTLTIVAEDTQTKPDLALEKVESFAARGIKLIVGPLSSGEVRAIKGYCDSNKILAISQSSTAPDLAIPDDYIFRFCPTDKLGQGPAIARIIYEDGKRYIIPVTRNDPWGTGLEEAVAKRFTELGGTVLEGIRYAPEAPEFSAEAADLASKVSDAVSKYGADKVCVLHISFEEVNLFFTAASEYDVLSTVKWYGSDGTCASSAMLEDPVVREFAYKVQYPSTIFAPMESAKWEMVRRSVMEILGREPESYSYAVYDIVWAYALSILKTDSTDPDAIKAVLPDVARSFFGASGYIDLDENGDRKAGDYVIWQIVKTDTDEYAWKVVGKYIYATDSVVWY